MTVEDLNQSVVLDLRQHIDAQRPLVVRVVDVWDTAKWDEAVWSSTQTLPFNRIDGAWGIGTVFAVATTGRSRGQTLLASWDVSWDAGGFL
jgi:hypothetical protein